MWRLGVKIESKIATYVEHISCTHWRSDMKAGWLAWIVRHEYSVLAILLVLVVSFVYHETPGNSFNFDDFGNIVRYAPVHMDRLDTAALAEAFSNPKIGHRYVPSLTFAIDWWRGGGKARAFLQTNVLLHVLTSLVLFGFVTQLMRRWIGEDRRSVVLVAFAVTALWALHPINSQAVNLIVQRMAILSTLFVLLSLSCYLAARGTAQRQPVAWLLGSVFFGALAAISKENAWILPLLIVGVEYGVIRHGEPLIRCNVDWAVLFAPFVLAGLLVLDLGTGAGPISENYVSGYAFRPFSMVERLLTQPRVVFYYMALVAWPMPGRFSVEHDFLVSTSLLSPPTTLLSLAALAGVIAVALFLFLRTRTRLPGFLLLWPLATLAIESSFIALELVFEHRMYLPLTGLAALVGISVLSLIRSYPEYSKAVVALLLLVAIGLSVSTMKRTSMWREPLLLYEDAVTKAPASSRAWGNLGLYRYQGGDAEGGLAALELAVDLGNGKDAKVLENLGVVYLDLGRLDDAASLIRHAYALQRERPAPSILNHMGEVELAMGRHAAAARYFRDAVNVASWNSVYYWNLALAYEGMSQCVAALAAWRRYLSLSRDASGSAQVEQHIGAVYHSVSGECYET